MTRDNTSWQTIALDVDEDGIAVLTLDRPDSLNAFDATMMRELVEVFDHTDADDDVRAVIMTGRGRAFCAGADLADGGGTFDYENQGDNGMALLENGVHRDGGGLVTLRMFESLKPILGAVNGPAVGVGASMLLPMDARLARSSVILSGW